MQLSTAVTALALTALAATAARPQSPATPGTAGQTPGTPPEGQEADPPMDPRERPPLVQFREQEAAELMAGIDGSWRLTRFLHSTSPLPTTSVQGFAILRSGYGTIVIHATDYPDEAFEPQYFYQALAFHYRFDQALRMQTSTILGHGNFDGELELEPNLAPREFNVELIGDMLILTRPDGSRLQFQRSVNDAFPEKTLLLIQEQRGRTPLPARPEDF